MSAGIVFKDILKAYFWKRDTLFYTTTLSRIFFNVKGTVMQIEKVLINNRLKVKCKVLRSEVKNKR